MEKDEKRVNKIRNEVEKTMRSLDNIKPVETDPFFFARLEAKIKRRESTNLTGEESEAIRWPGFSYAFAAVLILLLLNVLSVIYYGQQDTQIDVNQTELELLLENYEIEPTLVYELPEETESGD